MGLIANMSQLSTAESVKKWCVETLNNCSSQLLERIASNITEQDVDCEVLSLLCEDGEEEFTNILFGINADSKNIWKTVDSLSHVQYMVDRFAPGTLFRKVYRLKVGGDSSVIRTDKS